MILNKIKKLRFVLNANNFVENTISTMIHDDFNINYNIKSKFFF